MPQPVSSCGDSHFGGGVVFFMFCICIYLLDSIVFMVERDGFRMGYSTVQPYPGPFIYMIQMDFVFSASASGLLSIGDNSGRSKLHAPWRVHPTAETLGDDRCAGARVVASFWAWLVSCGGLPWLLACTERVQVSWWWWWSSLRLGMCVCLGELYNI